MLSNVEYSRDLIENQEIVQDENQDVDKKYYEFQDNKQDKIWFLKKMKNRGISEKRLEQIENCGNILLFHADKDKIHKKLKSANFCNHRFCPNCQSRLAAKEAVKLKAMMGYIKKEYEQKFIKMGLTIPNIPGEELEESIKKMNRAYKNLMQNPKMDKICNGYMRKLEVTYNSKSKDFHPHFHVLIAVDKSYKEGSDDYLTCKDVAELWSYYMKDPRIKNVDYDWFLDEVIGKNGKIKTVEEYTKYLSKPSDLYYSQKVFEVLFYALRRKQLVTYSGLFDKAQKLYNAGELDDYKTYKNDDVKYVQELLFIYNTKTKKYREDGSRLLSAQEILNLRRRCIEDDIINDVILE